MSASDIEYPEAIWSILVCPGCNGTLDRRDAGATCVACGTEYVRSASGQLDLRLQAPKEVSITTVVGRPQPTEIVVDKLAVNPAADPSVGGSGTATGSVNPKAASWMLPKRGAGERVLDLGCGAQPLRPLVEAAGYTYVGLDYLDPESQIFGDAHALPFADGTFESLLTVATVEFFQYPLVAAQEAYRVLAPGGRFVGTVGHLLPYLERTYYGHTHRGVLTTLETAGFEVERMMVPADWTALEAIAEMGLFPGIPHWAAGAAVTPVNWLSKLWWKIGRKVRPPTTDAYELVRCTSFFFFVATKPLAS